MRGLSIAAVLMLAGPALAQSTEADRLVVELVTGGADPARFDYGAVYFSDRQPVLWDALEQHLSTLSSAASAHDTQVAGYHPALCQTTAIVHGRRAAERADNAEVYDRQHTAAMAWADGIRAGLAAETARAEAVAASPVHADILRQSLQDQAWRSAFGQVMSGQSGLAGTGMEIGQALAMVRMCETDIENLAFLRDYLATHGWPRISEQGEEIDNAVWILLQHAPPPNQEAWLPELARLHQAGETNPRNYALLHDRVMMNRGEPQRYGSQYVCSEDGIYVMYETEDPDSVDALRAQMGMSSVTENATRFEGLACDPE